MSGECDRCGEHCLDCMCEETKKTPFIMPCGSSGPITVYPPADGSIITLKLGPHQAEAMRILYDNVHIRNRNAVSILSAQLSGTFLGGYEVWKEASCSCLASTRW